MNYRGNGCVITEGFEETSQRLGALPPEPSAAAVVNNTDPLRGTLY